MADKPKKPSDTVYALLAAGVTREDHLVRLPRLPVAAARQVVRSMLNAAVVEEVPAPIEAADYAWRTGEDGGLLMLRATTLGLARVEEGKVTVPAVASVANVTMTAANRIASTDTGTAQAEVASVAEDQPVSASPPNQDHQDGPLGANRKAPTRVAGHPAETAQALSSPALRAGRRGSLHRAAHALLDAWDGLADTDKAIAGMISGPVNHLRRTLASLAPADPAGPLPPRECWQHHHGGYDQGYVSTA